VVIPIELAIEPRVQARPGLLFVGEVEKGMKVSRVIKLSTRGASFRISAVKAEIAGLAFSCTEGYSDEHAITFTVCGDDVNTLSGKSIRVILETDITREVSEITLPIYAFSK
jgi:hypothetical protein